MPSPFPGMDPYIEGRGLWEDFHPRLISRIADALAPLVPRRYRVRTGQRSYVTVVGRDGKETSPFLPDVSIQAAAGAGGGTSSAGAAATAAGPVTVRAFIDTHFRENFIEIHDTEPERQLVTCIEVLSPSNKRVGSEGWRVYLRKRQALLLREANLVEIDLLRGGTRFPMLDDWPSSPYTILVGTRDRSPRCDVWPACYRQPLPTVPVPLTDPDPAVPIDLQALVAAVYDVSKYELDIDYTRPLDLGLPPEDVAWLAERVRATA